MKLPLIPILVAVTLLLAVVYLFNSTASVKLVLDVPRLARLADIAGVETEVAIAPNGIQYAVISSGDLWLFNSSDGSSRQVTRTPEPETFPAWTPDGLRLTFSRGPDTVVVHLDNPEAEQIFKADATSLVWSPTGRIAFVRNRSLWLANPTGSNERQIVAPDVNADVTIRTPRFSPDSVQIAFIKTVPGLRGEVWTVNVLTGAVQASIADRQAENPLDVGWVTGGRNLVYLTNRAGAYSVWFFDLAENTIMPLTPPLFGMPLADVGMAVWKDRVVLPRHFVDSDIILSDGTPVVHTEDMEFEPAVSPDGQLVAYTIEKENKFELWTATIRGENPTFRALGREPRFSPDGFQIVYTHTDLAGNPDLWRIDLRDNSSGIVTDADEIDINPDWSPDGRNIVFASGRGGSISIWTIAASGGKRLRLNDGGYFPRYSPDGRSILFWNHSALWTMDANGGSVKRVRDQVPGPAPAVFAKGGPLYYADAEVSANRMIWPRFDTLKDGRYVIAPIEVRATELWSIDLTYKKN